MKKTIQVTAFGRVRTLVAQTAEYGNGRLAITLGEPIDPNSEDYAFYPEGIEPFGVLTVNLAAPCPEKHAYIKTWSENEGWAEEAARALGGKPTRYAFPTGYVTAPLWDFSALFEQEN